MTKKILSVACLWLMLALLVFACTDREAYTWRFGADELDSILVSLQQAEEMQAAADAVLLAEREAAALRSERGEWNVKETFGGAPMARSAQDDTPGLNLMWGRYEATISLFSIVF